MPQTNAAGQGPAMDDVVFADKGRYPCDSTRDSTWDA